MALEGTFQDMSLNDLFQIFVMGNKSGVLILHQSTVCGVIYVLDGRGRDALIVQQPDNTVVASGERAVLHILTWKTARFTFRHDLAVKHRPLRIVHDWEWLEQAASHQISRAPLATATKTAPVEASIRSPIPPACGADAATTHPGLSSPTVPTLSPDVPLQLVPRSPTSARTIKFSVDEWRVLSWIAQGVSVRQIANTTGCELALILAIVNELYMDGLVTMAPHAVGSDAPPISKPKATLPCRTSLTTAVVPERRIVEAVMRRIRGV